MRGCWLGFLALPHPWTEKQERQSRQNQDSFYNTIILKLNQNSKGYQELDETEIYH